MENEESSHGDETEADQVVPFHGLAEVENRKHGKDGQRDDFLNGFQLRGVEFVRAEAVAGTWKQYSKKAMPQLATTTFQSATLRYFRCPYQAKVMKMLEMVSSRIVCIGSFVSRETYGLWDVSLVHTVTAVWPAQAVQHAGNLE